jgi:hypothetical protein
LSWIITGALILNWRPHKHKLSRSGEAHVEGVVGRGGADVVGAMDVAVMQSGTTRCGPARVGLGRAAQGMSGGAVGGGEFGGTSSMGEGTRALGLPLTMVEIGSRKRTTETRKLELGALSIG